LRKDPLQKKKKGKVRKKENEKNRVWGATKIPAVKTNQNRKMVQKESLTGEKRTHKGGKNLGRMGGKWTRL